jgi:hypothetical protein
VLDDELSTCDELESTELELDTPPVDDDDDDGAAAAITTWLYKA